MRSRVEFVFAYGRISAQSYFDGEFWDVLSIQVRLLFIRVIMTVAHFIWTGSWTAPPMISVITVCLCFILPVLHFGKGITYMMMKHIKISARMLSVGVELARLADLPPDVLVEGKRVAEKLHALQTQQEGASESAKTAVKRKALLRVIDLPLGWPMALIIDLVFHTRVPGNMQLRTQLVQAYEHSALPDRELMAYVGRFQRDIARAFIQR